MVSKPCSHLIVWLQTADLQMVQRAFVNGEIFPEIGGYTLCRDCHHALLQKRSEPGGDLEAIEGDSMIYYRSKD